MSFQLHEIKAAGAPRKKARRVGRGRGSGCGKTSGYGMGGQRARSGDHGAGLYEGGQMPLFRKLPQRGFSNARYKARFAVVNVGALQDAFADGAAVDPAALLRVGVLAKLEADGVKILGTGELTRPLTVKAHAFSQSALAKIQAAGGTAETIAD
jgi:large subunit ribosomal protein L15